MKTVVFACVHSAGRSQMAAGWFRQLANATKAKALAAGTSPAEQVHPIVVDAMREMGIDLSPQRPQLLTETLLAEAALLVTMGCGESCPTAPTRLRRLDWSLDDPKGQPIETVRAIRDDVRQRVEALLRENGWHADP